MATMSSPPGARFKGASKGFQIDTFPPYIASPFWPTAPYVPAPKFVRMPENVRFVPEHNWGCSGDMPDCACCQSGEDGQFGALGAGAAKKKQAKKRAAKLRQRASKVEKKAGIVRKPTKAKLPQKGVGAKKKAPPRKKAAAAEESPEESPEESAEESAEKEMPAPEGVPQDAAEGSANMKYIIGGTLALMAAIGVGFAMQQSKKKKAAAASPGTLPAAPLAASPRPALLPPPAPAVAALPEIPFTRTERVAEPAEESAEMPISANPRGSLLMRSVRPLRR